MTIAEQIKGFLQEREESWYCDDCLRKRLGLKRRQQAQAVTAAIAFTGNFKRGKGPCFECGEEKLVSRFSK